MIAFHEILEISSNSLFYYYIQGYFRDYATKVEAYIFKLIFMRLKIKFRIHAIIFYENKRKLRGLQS